MFLAALYILLALSTMTLLIAVFKAQLIAAPRWVTAQIDAHPAWRRG